MQTSADAKKDLGSTAGAVPIDPAPPSAPATDEMGNELEALTVWHVECACIPAGMYPSVSAFIKLEYAKDAAAQRRAEAHNWAAVRITGPHTFFRPKKDAFRFGPRKGIPADLGCEAL